MKKPFKPILGLTMGDPAGVGPEVVARALAEDRVRDMCRPLILGDVRAMRAAVDRLGLDLPLTALEPGQMPPAQSRAACILPISDLAENERRPGRPTVNGGRAAAEYVEAGADMALSGAIHGLVTAPISKEALRRAGYAFTGHTSLLAHKAGRVKVVMMMAGARLNVALVTIHQALRDVPGLLTVEGILTTAEITHRSMETYWGFKPRLAVAGLNPHAGEGGLFGREEADVIEPAVAQARERGLNISGPYPPDTLFFRAAGGEFDAVLCMYHDQGLIPFKLLHFKDGVNVTLGLPFIRTSVDHGTAYDIAGHGVADHASMSAALDLAARMAGQSRRGGPTRQSHETID